MISLILVFAMADEEIELLVEHTNGEQELIEFDKDYDEDFGVEFERAVFDGIRECANHCCFCFVDMIAPNMRHSLSVKDDDYRLSFLYGNFVTLTNMGPADFHASKAFTCRRSTFPYSVRIPYCVLKCSDIKERQISLGNSQNWKKRERITIRR